LNYDEQGERKPIQISVWDLLALLSDTVSDLFTVISNFFTVLTHMLDTHASFVDDKKSFHEYAARTIETLQKGE
jgi:hypothetical protein